MNYSIEGGQLPVVICDLKHGETMITESGSMSWMSPNIRMETSGGGIGKMFGRMFSGESLFLNRYTAEGDGMIAFSSSFPGSIRAIEITPSNPVVVQKKGFLAAQDSVELSVFFQKKGMAGFFGGEGFIMQKLSGSGTAFVEIDGSVVEYDRAARCHDRAYRHDGRLLLHGRADGKGSQERALRRRRPLQHRRDRPRQGVPADDAPFPLRGRHSADAPQQEQLTNGTDKRKARKGASAL